MKVFIFGLGYVGLPLCIEVSKTDYSVEGFDIDSQKISDLVSLNLKFENADINKLKKLIKQKKIKFSNESSGVTDADIIILTVPTPLSKGKPDRTYLTKALNVIGKNHRTRALLILESTVETGYTRKILKKLDSMSKSYNLEIDIAFSPERIDPLNKNWDLKNTPKLVAGLTDRARDRAVEFYSKFIDTVIPCSSLEVAETAKLLENSFRLINISFINELSIFCQKIGIDVNEVIKAASTKPYGFMPFYPSVGIGGHCIPIDPVYLSHKAKEIGAPTNFIDLAIKVNHQMPKYFVKRAGQILGNLKNKKILVLGVSYKPNISDVRETPVESLIDGLRKKGAKVKWHDDIVKKWRGEKSAEITDKYDLAIIATPHDYLDIRKLGKTKILNTRSSV